MKRGTQPPGEIPHWLFFPSWLCPSPACLQEYLPSSGQKQIKTDCFLFALVLNTAAAFGLMSGLVKSFLKVRQPELLNSIPLNSASACCSPR